MKLFSRRLSCFFFSFLYFVFLLSNISIATDDDIFWELEDILNSLEEDIIENDVFFGVASNDWVDALYNYITIDISVTWVWPESVLLTIPWKATASIQSLWASLRSTNGETKVYRITKISIPHNSQGNTTLTLDPYNSITETNENNNTLRIGLTSYTESADASVKNLRYNTTNKTFSYDVCFDQNKEWSATITTKLTTPKRIINNTTPITITAWCRTLSVAADPDNNKTTWTYVLDIHIDMSAIDDTQSQNNAISTQQAITFPTPVPIQPTPAPVDIPSQEEIDAIEETDVIETETEPEPRIQPEVKVQPRNNSAILENAPESNKNINEEKTIISSYDLLSAYCLSEQQRIRSCTKLFDLNELRWNIHELVSLIFLLLDQKNLNDSEKLQLTQRYRLGINNLTSWYDDDSYSMETKTRLAFLFAYIDYSFSLYESHITNQETYIETRTFFSQW